MSKNKNRKDWSRAWKFSSRELRALLWLLPVLAVVSWLVWEIARPPFNDALPEYADLVNSAKESPAPEAEAETAADSLFGFDPNTIEYHDLCRLGFTRNEALGIVKYRERGKIFEIPEDFASCWQVSEAMYRKLQPYINIGKEYRLKNPARTERSGWQEKPAARQTELRPFSLDTITSAGLRALGFSARQAEVIVNYRDMKGGLRSAEEFAECYVVSDEMFARLEPYLVFPEKAAKSSATAAPVNLNTADSTALRSVAGIGEKTVVSIMDYRERLGGFVRAEQLAEVRGVTEQNYERICTQIFVDSCDILKIDINFASAKLLGRHPYINAEQLRKLLKLRQLKGGWNNTGQLIEDKIFTPQEAEKLAPYLLFGRSAQ